MTKFTFKKYYIIMCLELSSNTESLFKLIFFNYYLIQMLIVIYN